MAKKISKKTKKAAKKSAKKQKLAKRDLTKKSGRRIAKKSTKKAKAQKPPVKPFAAPKPSAKTAPGGQVDKPKRGYLAQAKLEKAAKELAKKKLAKEKEAARKAAAIQAEKAKKPAKKPQKPPAKKGDVRKARAVAPKSSAKAAPGLLADTLARSQRVTMKKPGKKDAEKPVKQRKEVEQPVAKRLRKAKSPAEEALPLLPTEIVEKESEKSSSAPKRVVKAKSSQHLFADVLARVQAVCASLAAEGGWPNADLSRVVVEPPRDASHGDMATNAAMVLAKEAKAKPRDLAEQIATKLRADDLIEKVDVAGPGFINLTLKPQVWAEALRTVLREGDAYGRSGIGAAEKVNVEYVSANPTGPMHVGHCRGAVFGDALSSLLAFAGYEVTREYYINDAGAQVDVLARSAFLRYREALGQNIGEVPEGLYPGDYLKPVGQALAADHGDGLLKMTEAEWLPIVRAKAIAMMMEEIKGDLAALSIKHDVFFSERSLIETGNNRVAETVDYLRSKGDVYEGRLPPPKGGPVEDYEDREQTLFRATAYGDDVDRPLLKSDGSYTYFAADIAYHKTKFDRGFREMIDVWGADHGGYVKRVQAAIKAVTSGKAALDVKIVQLVKLLRAGEPVKMSKRSGDFVTLREVVDEVGSDAVRFMMLYRKNDAVLDFDLAKVIEQSRENPVFYVQYGHARGHSVFRNAREVVPDLPEDAMARAAFLADAAVERLTDAAELDLLRRLALYPRTIEAAAVAHEPHRIAFYLYDLASEFHALWTRGRDLPYLRFIINNDAEITKARLALVQGVVSVLASGLAVLGVHAPDEMR
jgi:arginyl-tRNA synthetase